MTNNRHNRFSRVVLTAAVITLLIPSAALAQSGGDYGLTWSTVDAGGAMFSTGGDYDLGGTVGQPDAGLLVGGDYALGGGFWGGGALGGLKSRVHLPVVLRTAP